MSHYHCPECPPIHEENARLHAEVEHLKADLAEALLRPTWDRYAKAQERLTVETEKTVALSHERDEALAQVALLVKLCEEVRIAEAPEEYLRELEAMLEGDRVAEARALLDRLQRAETENAELKRQLNAPS